MKKFFLRFHGVLFFLLVSISVFSNKQDNNDFADQFQLYVSPYNVNSVNQNSTDSDNIWYTSVSYSMASYETQSENNRSTVTEAQLYNAITLAAIKSKLTPNQYLKFYGVEQPVFKRLVGESLEYAKNWIISDRKLTKEQRLRVWDACCATKWFQKEQKLKGRIKIEKEFDKQQKKEEAIRALEDKQIQKPEDVKKAQDQKFLQKKENINQSSESNEIRFTNQKTFLQQRLEDLGINPAQYVYLPSDLQMLQEEYLAVENVCDSMILIDESDSWSLRKAALQKTKDENFTQSWQEIKISDRAKAYLQSQNLKHEMYTRCYGTALQQEVNRKNCEIIELIAQKQHDMLPKTTFLGYAIQCVDASWWANEFEAIVLAAGLQDLGNQCCHVGDWIIRQALLYGKAISDGVVESGHDFLDMVSHPLDTINNFAKAAYFVTETLALYDPELWLDNADIFEPFQKQRQELISSMVSAGIHSIKDADGPQRVKMATKFVSDCIFQHKALQVVGAVAGVLRTQAGAMRTMEFVNDIMGSELAYAGVTEKIAQVTEELEVVVQKSVAESIAVQKSKPVLPVGSKILTLAESVAKVKKYGGKIPVRDLELHHNIKYWIEQVNKKVNTKIEPILFEQYGKMTQIAGNTEMSICMDLEHIINPRYQLIKDKSGAFYTVNFKGGHLAGTISKLEKEGLVKIHSSIEFGKGCIEYQAEDLFTGRIFKHTEFPPHWNVEKIAQETQFLYKILPKKDC